MVSPLPWSYTALDDFVNCPHAYHEKRVLKRFKEEKSPQMIYGEQVHKAFEDRMASGVVLPADLARHEDVLAKLEKVPGQQFTERKIALAKSLQPCGFFDRDVWFRGVIDYTKVNDRYALIVDYKTGKLHRKFQQLQLFALHTFTQYPSVNEVEVRYYWTQTSTYTGDTYLRSQVGSMWAKFVPDLTQYVEAFKGDVWQKRPSGLCPWCPVTTCEFWRPRRQR